MFLTYKKLISILKSSKISGHLLLRNLKDPLVFSASPNLKSGHWKATSLAQVTEAEVLQFYVTSIQGWLSKC